MFGYIAWAGATCEIFTHTHTRRRRAHPAQEWYFVHQPLKCVPSNTTTHQKAYLRPHIQRNKFNVRANVIQQHGVRVTGMLVW